MTWTFREWYAQNREEYNKKRRRRYTSDEEYRSRVLEQNRRLRDVARQEKEKEEGEEKSAIRVRLRTIRSKTIKVGGKNVVVFPIGVLAGAVGLGVQVLRKYEHRGVIPKPKHFYGKGDRMYTAEEILRIREILTKEGKIGSNVWTRGERFSQKRKIRLANGKNTEIDLFRIGKLATALGKTVQTVIKMEERGVLPETPFRVKGQRAYTADMIRSAAAVAAAIIGALRGANATRFKTAVEKEWKTLNVIGASLQS